MLSKLKEELKSIEFIDLKTQQAQIRSKIDQALQKVLNHGTYIMWTEVKQFEADMSEFCGVKHSFLVQMARML